MRLTRNRSKNSNEELVLELPTRTRRSTRKRATAQDSNEIQSVSSTQEDHSQQTESESEVAFKSEEPKILGSIKVISSTAALSVEKKDEAQEENEDEYEDDAIVGEYKQSFTAQEEEEEADDYSDLNVDDYDMLDDADEDEIEAKYAEADHTDDESEDDVHELKKQLNDESDLENNEDDDDAPEEVSFSVLKSQADAERQKKLEFERTLKETLKAKRRQMDEKNLSQKTKSEKPAQPTMNKSDKKSKQPEAIHRIVKKKIETASSKLKVVSSKEDQLNSIYFKHVRANAARNNRVISFKDNTIMKRHVKRLSATGFSRSLQKQAALKY